MRLRCRAHNQYEAERMFGVEFMRGKREQRSRRRIAGERTRTVGPAAKHTGDVVAGLRALGLRADEARRASEHAATLGEVTLEEGLRAALQFVGRRTISRTVPGLQPRAAAWASP